MAERNTDSVVTLLRPLLKDLHVQCLTIEPRIVATSDYRELIMAGIGRCIICARQTAFKDDTRGCFVVSYNKDHKVFLFVINVNRNLFQNNSSKSKTERKAVAVHEFVHCTSALLLLSCLQSEGFIECMRSIIVNKVTITTSSEFNSLLSALKNLDKGKINPPELLTDEHFRIDYKDKFIGDYGDLYLNFLLSYQLLRETMMEIKKQHGNSGISLKDLLPEVHKELVEEKALERNFVLGRIRTFLPNIVTDYIDNIRVSFPVRP
jgi:hypothetical protein